MSVKRTAVTWATWRLARQARTSVERNRYFRSNSAKAARMQLKAAGETRSAFVPAGA